VSVLLLTIIAAGSILVAPAAAKKKPKNNVYFGHVKASGQWQVHWDCVMDSYTSIWQFEALYGKSVLEPAGELNETIGGASGRVDYQLDRLCNGSVESGNCSVVQNEYTPPFFLDKVKGGLRVDAQIPLAVSGCGTHQVSAYYEGFETIGDRMEKLPSGFIPEKKIGKKTITVPLSGSDSGSAAGRTFSGTMSGTLELTKKKPLLALPF
jgi:hypothetical protein